MKKLIIIGLVFSVFSCSNREEIQPIRKDISELVFASGELSWDDAYNITAQTDGVLTDVNFEIGDQISKGKKLAFIDNPSNRINKKSAQEQLLISNENVNLSAPNLQQMLQNIQIAENKYEQDKIQLERYQRLFANQSIAKIELENVELTAKNSLANLKALQKQLAFLKQQAKQQQILSKGQAENFDVLENYNQLRATEAGTVIKKFKSAGDFVKKGDVIATVANQNKMEAILNVDENNIEKIKLGQKVFIQLNSNKKKIYQGKISEILAAFDIQSQSFLCKVKFDETMNTSLFGVQLEANVLIGKKSNVILIPRSYVGFGNTVRLKGKDEPHKIKTGIVSTEYVEVVSGLTLSDVLLPLKH